MQLIDAARLIYCSSKNTSKILGDCWITKPVVTLGRLVEGSSQPDIDLELQSVSREHARIEREGDGFTLHCCSSQGVLFYERTLDKHERVPLNINDFFSLPANRHEDDEYYQFRFLASPYLTLSEPIFPVYRKQALSVYGSLVRLTPTEDQIFRLLYERPDHTCDYKELIAHIWDAKDIPEYDERLRQQLLVLRKKIRRRGRELAPEEHKPRTRARAAVVSEEAADAESQEHCFLDIKWGKSVRLCIDDVVADLKKYDLSHPAHTQLS